MIDHTNLESPLNHSLHIDKGIYVVCVVKQTKN